MGVIATCFVIFCSLCVNASVHLRASVLVDSRLSGLGVCLVPQKHACQVFTAATAPLFFPFHFVDLHLIGDSRIGYQICRFLSFRLVLTDPRRFSGSLLWRGLSLDYPSIVPKFGEGGALLHSKSLVGLVRVVQEYVRCEPRNFKSEKGAALILILDQVSDAGGDPTGAGSSIKSEWQNVLSIAARIRSYSIDRITTCYKVFRIGS